MLSGLSYPILVCSGVAVTKARRFKMGLQADLDQLTNFSPTIEPMSAVRNSRRKVVIGSSK